MTRRTTRGRPTTYTLEKIVGWTAENGEHQSLKVMRIQSGIPRGTSMERVASFPLSLSSITKSTAGGRAIVERRRCTNPFRQARRDALQSPWTPLFKLGAQANVQADLYEHENTRLLQDRLLRERPLRTGIYEYENDLALRQRQKRSCAAQLYATDLYEPAIYESLLDESPRRETPELYEIDLFVLE
jgi:hypothetical protein